MGAEVPIPNSNKKMMEIFSSAYPDSKISISGILPDSKSGHLHWVSRMVWELTDNCDLQGAKEVSINYRSGYIRVSDNVVHKDPKAILQNLNSDHIVSSSENPEAGHGIRLIREWLKPHEGELVYCEEDGKIIAEARWKSTDR